MQVEQVDFINVPTRDTQRAFAWYRDVLGLPLDPNNAEELRAGQVTVTFWEPEREGFEFKPDVGGFAVRVADVEAAKSELEAKGAECVGSGNTGVCNMAVFLDPDGNAVILHRRYKPYE
ncbi:MAG: VOC family protein [Gaiellaceae bacterium]|jgi:catechol 2,3-dioxygenase-like lactoylglutathione lyase family enzyme